VGRALVRRLAATGEAEVTGTYRRTSPPDIAGVQWRQLSTLQSQVAWTSLVSDAECVVHLAALAHQVGSAGEGRWEEFHRTNVEGTRLLAQACADAQVRRLIFLSSIAAMGTGNVEPTDAYGRSKLDAERALIAQLEDRPTDWCILRPPLVYGPENPGNMARLMRLVAKGIPLPFASIRNRRSFIYIDNLIDAILTVIRYARPIRSAFVVHDGSDFSTPELVTALAAASGRPARMFGVPDAFLRGLGRAGDLVSEVSGRSFGIDTYSVSRLTQSLSVNGSVFCQFFGWRPPVDPGVALAATCRETTKR
jgi:nucleoside-diphosphate-sugar epimerase